MSCPEVRRILLSAAALAAAAVVHGAEDTQFRYQASIAVDRPGAFVQLPLKADAYAHSLEPGLLDLRVVDATGARVPFAVLGPRGNQVETIDRARDATIYPLPPKPSADGTWTAPIELSVVGDRISVTRRGGPPPDGAGASRSGGWLVDLGQRAPTDPLPRAVRFEWSGPAEFTAAFQFETSDDLRGWHFGGSGQLMALASPTGALAQPNVVLPDSPGRFVRFVWVDAASAPAITKAVSLSPAQRSVALDPPVELVFAPGSAPIGPRDKADSAEARALYFDLGGVLPVGQIDLRWPAGTRVAPVRIDGRLRDGDAWQSLGAGVFYRLDRSGVAATSGPVAIGAFVRHVRITPDPRAGDLDAGHCLLVVSANLASVVFAAQGQPPYRLLAGSATAPVGSLPIGTLVPSLDDERARFGRATLGPWSEVTAAVRQAESERRGAIVRQALLWSVLVGGVAGLGFMVWRLSRTTPSRSGD